MKFMVNRKRKKVRFEVQCFNSKSKLHFSMQHVMRDERTQKRYKASNFSIFNIEKDLSFETHDETWFKLNFRSGCNSEQPQVTEMLNETGGLWQETSTFVISLRSHMIDDQVQSTTAVKKTTEALVMEVKLTSKWQCWFTVCKTILSNSINPWFKVHTLT